MEAGATSKSIKDYELTRYACYLSSKFDDFLQEQLQDPEIRKEYEALQLEHTVIQSEIDTAQKSGMPPKELDF